MTSDVEQALWALEESVQGVLRFVKAAAYGLRLASKRMGDLASSGGSTQNLAPGGAEELDSLREALVESDQRLTELSVLALGDHFRSFLQRGLGLAEMPALPRSGRELEALTGTPGAVDTANPWLQLCLELYRVTLAGGGLDRAALNGLGGQLELRYPGGKVRSYQAGDRVILTGAHLESVGSALLDAARAVKAGLHTV